MDLASIGGLILGATVMVLTIVTAGDISWRTFFDLPSLLVVFGGSIAAVLLCFPFYELRNLARVLKKVFVNRPDDSAQLARQLVWLAEIARREGLLALEPRLPDLKHPLLVLGVQMVLDGTRPEVIEHVLRTEMEVAASRHRNGKGVIDQLGRFAPAFGMIGTLLGLILMLSHMADLSALGPGMAVALLTTFYGAILANALFLPCAEKLGFIHRQEQAAMELVVRGVLAIRAGDHPRLIQQRLHSLVPPHFRIKARKAA